MNKKLLLLPTILLLLISIVSATDFTTESHGVTQNVDWGVSSDFNGFRISTNNELVYLYEVYKTSPGSCEANVLRLMHDNGTIIHQDNFTAETGVSAYTFNPVIALQPNTYYRIEIGRTNGTYDDCQYGNTSSFPNNGTKINWVENSFNGGDTRIGNDYYAMISTITLTNEVYPNTDVNLSLMNTYTTNYVKLEEGSSPFANEVAGGNNWTCAGAACPTTATGIIGNALEFYNANSSLITTGETIGNDSKKSTSSWVYITDNTTAGIIISDSGAYWVTFYGDPVGFTGADGEFSCNNYDGNADVITSSGVNVQQNTWYHVACTHYGNKIELWVDGVSYGTTDTGVTQVITGTYQVGGIAGASRHVDAIIDEVAFFHDYDLSQGEVSYLYNSGSPGSEQQYQYTEVNVTPTAPNITARSPTGTNVNLNLQQNQTFNITVTEADGDPLSYDWLINGSSQGVNNTNYQFNGSTGKGVYNLTASVTDKDGSDNTSWLITVVGTSPTITAYSPTNQTPSITVGDTINMNITVTELDNDTLNYEWYVDSISQTNNLSTFTFDSTPYGVGTNDIEVIVWDEDGNDTTSWNVTVNAAPVTPTGYQETYTAKDTPKMVIDILAKIFVTFVLFAALIGLIVLVGWGNKRTKKGE